MHPASEQVNILQTLEYLQIYCCISLNWLTPLLNFLDFIYLKNIHREKRLRIETRRISNKHQPIQELIFPFYCFDCFFLLFYESINKIGKRRYKLGSQNPSICKYRRTIGVIFCLFLFFKNFAGGSLEPIFFKIYSNESYIC